MRKIILILVKVGVIYLIFIAINFQSFSFAAEGIADTTLQALDTIIQGIYSLTWFLLIIASYSISNDLVYGTVFGLDKYLWMIWNVMKNFANFAIGFLLIASVLLYWFGIKQDKFSPKRFIPKLFVAGVLVNMSWFLFMVLIDISTILTYSVGALPIHISKIDENNKVLMVNQTIKLDKDFLSKTNSTGEQLVVYFTDKNGSQYLPCLYSGGNVYFDKSKFNTGFLENLKNLNESYCVVNYKGIALLQHNGTNGIKYGSEEFKKRIKKGKNEILNKQGFTVSELLGEDLALGPLYYIYQNILGFAQSVPVLKQEKQSGTQQEKTANVNSIFWVQIIKIFFFLFLILPLLLIGIVMIIRVFFLWILLAISPILVLLWTLGFGAKGFLEKYSIKNVLTLIFLPVVVLFAVGVGFLFLTSLQDIFYVDDVDESKQLQSQLGIIEKEKTNFCNDGMYLGIEQFENFSICIKFSKGFNTALWEGVDMWWYLMIFVFMTFIFWTMVIAALKTSKFTEAFVAGVDDFVKSLAKAMPVIPTPGGRLSLGALQKGIEQIKAIPQTKINKQFNESKLGEFYSKLISDKKEKVEMKITNLSNQITVGDDNAKQAVVSFLKKDFDIAEYESIYDYEDKVVSLFNKAFNKNFKNIKEVFEDKDVISYLVNNGIDINKIIEKLYGEQKKRLDRTGYADLTNHILFKLYNQLTMLGFTDKGNDLYLKTEENKVLAYKFIKGANDKFVGVDMLNASSGNLTGLQQIVDFANKYNLDITELIGNSKEFEIDQKKYKIEGKKGNYKLESLENKQTK